MLARIQSKLARPLISLGDRARRETVLRSVIDEAVANNVGVDGVYYDYDVIFVRSPRR